MRAPVMSRRLAPVLFALLACRPAPPPSPQEPPSAASPGRCEGPSIFDRPLASWHRPTQETIACEPAPGRAGWVSEQPPPGANQTSTLVPAAAATAEPPPRVVLALSAADRPWTAAERERLEALSGPQAELRALDGRATTVAAVEQALSDMAKRIGPLSHVRMFIRGRSARAGGLWGCVPVQDGCVPLSALQSAMGALRGRSWAAVVEGDAPGLSAALWADGRTAVASFGDDAAGRAAARAFWAATRDLDGDGQVALRERFAAADPPAKSAVFLDPTGTLTWQDAAARPALPDEVMRPKDLAEVERAAKQLRAGEYLVVYFADRDCVDCELIDRKNFRSLAKSSRGLRYAAFSDGRALLQQLGQTSSLVEPAVAYYDRRGRPFGWAADPTRPLGSLAAALAPAERQAEIWEAWMHGQDLERVKLAAAAVLRAEGGGEAALLRMARRVHEDGEPMLVMAVLAALTRGKWASAAATPEVLSHIDHPDPAVRIAVVDTLLAIQAEPSAVLCPVISAIPDPSAGVRERVRRLLFAFLREVEPGVPAMATLLVDKDAAVRRAAVEAFAELNAGERAAAALPELVNSYLGEQEVAVRRQALVAIVQLGPAAAPALTDLQPGLVGDPDPESRALLAEIFGRCGAQAACARADLELLAREDEPMPRSKAAQALEKIAAGR